MELNDDDELESLRDGDLFRLMADGAEKVERAFDIFHKRYVRDFHNLVKGISSDTSIVEDLVSKTMEEAYLKAETFKEDNSLSLKSERGRTLAWLGKIARNIYNQNFRISQKSIKIVSQDDKFEETSLIEEATENGFITKGALGRKIREAEDEVLGGNYVSVANAPLLEKRILREVLSELSERDRDVLIAYYNEYDPEIKNQKLSKEAIKELCESYNITPDNIRQIKLRTFKKVSEKCLKIKAKIAESKI
jgi:RNA polymerase sigma factor (sigma-70 family)